MKKLIALILVLTALLGVASAAFTDKKSISSTYAVAVDTMVEAGIISGFPDGTFQPKGTLTRAQAAKIICVMLEGEKADSVTSAAAGFTDVPAGNWAEKYINYCAEKGIVAGVGNNKFNPNGELTGAAWAKMLLVAYGHPAEELTGSSWFSNTQKAIREKGMNKNAFTSDAPTNREKACQLAYNFYHKAKTDSFESTVLAPAGYKEATISLADGKNMKLLGRAEATKNGVVTNFPGDGVEFILDCGGTLSMTIDAKDTGNAYQVFVDGTAVGNSVSSSAAELVLSELLQPGEHTIRIVQDKEINTSGKTNTMKELKISTKGGTPKAAPLKDLYIEYIGASCEAGCGTLGDNSTTWSTDYHSITHSHTYLTAEAMNADYSMVARGGIGLLKKNGKHSMNTLYFLQNGYRGTEEYAFTRKPDVICISLPGGNDRSQNADDLYAAFVPFLKQLREKNGEQCKIVMFYGVMYTGESSSFKTMKEKVQAEFGGEAKGIYLVELPNGTNGVPSSAGGTGHPSYADAQKQAAAMVAFLKSIL